MSPEHAAARWHAVGPASDVYSLGATLFQLLTGRPPVTGRNDAELLLKAQSGQYLSPRQVNPAVPPSLEAVCLKAMAYASVQRYQTPLELAADLECYLADEPVNAYRDPMTARWRRWARKHRAFVASAAAALVLSVLGLTIGLVIVASFNQQLSIEKDSAKSALDDRTAFSSFLVKDVLAVPRLNPRFGGMGLNVTMEQALDRAVPKLSERCRGRRA
jgi:serine/threonine protein kinase